MLRTRGFTPGVYVPPVVVPPPAGTYAFVDEFNGTALDTSKWALEDLGYGYGSLEQFRPGADLATIVTEGGKTFLRVSAVKRRSDPTAGARNWDAAFGTTRGASGSTRFTLKTGTVEWGMRLPTAQGAWPALWLDNGALGENTRYGEIDLMELFPGGGSKGPGPYFTVHDWWQNSGGGSKGTNRVMSATAHTDGLWHDYKVTWDASGFQTWFDGVPSGSITPAQFASESGGEGNFTQSFLGPDYYLIFDMAVGTSWGGPEPLAGVTRLDMDIDYIRVTKTS